MYNLPKPAHDYLVTLRIQDDQNNIQCCNRFMRYSFFQTTFNSSCAILKKKRRTSVVLFDGQGKMAGKTKRLIASLKLFKYKKHLPLI